MKLGILCLETRFERQPGDAGHAATWPFEVCMRVMQGVTPEAVMQPGNHNAAALDSIVGTMQALADEGADCITTTCGFLVLWQQALAARCPVPFISSSLLQLPWLLALLPASLSIGVLASSAQALTPAHWRAAGIASEDEKRLRVAGFDGQSHFIRYLRGQDKAFDAQRQQDEVLALARGLVQQHPDIGAMVSECANLPRHANAIRTHTRRPVFDLRTLVLWYANRQG